MLMSAVRKEQIKRELANCLRTANEIRKIVVFGSFVTDSNPNDVDIAVFQDSNEGYLPLALKYRRMARSVADQIPLDIVPLRAEEKPGAFLREIDQGEIIYER